LIGVVIHSGVAAHGHYVSIVNTGKMDKKSSWDNTMSMTWNLFDDSHVTTYSVPTNFESDTFGDKFASGG